MNPLKNIRSRSLISLIRDYKEICEIEKKINSGKLSLDSIPLSMFQESLYNKDVEDELFKRLKALDK